MVSAVGGERSRVMGGPNQAKEILKIGACLFFFFFFTSFKTNDKKRDWISLYIRNKNDYQMESGRMWWGGVGVGVGGVRQVKWFIVLF